MKFIIKSLNNIFTAIFAAVLFISLSKYSLDHDKHLQQAQHSQAKPVILSGMADPQVDAMLPGARHKVKDFIEKHSRGVIYTSEGDQEPSDWLAELDAAHRAGRI